MRHFILLLSAVLMAVTGRTEDFTKTMTPEERAATGIDRLSPQELEQLKAVVERYKTGEVAVVKKEAEQKVAVAEAKVKAVEAKAEMPATGGKKQPGWISALLTLQKAQEKPEEMETFEDHLKGTLKGFEGKRRFTLQSGQVWEMIQSDYYSGPPIESPPVTVKPGVLGAYWLTFPTEKLRFKVKLVKIE